MNDLMDDFTPSTFEVGQSYARRFGIEDADERRAAFDRWLAEHDREVAAAALENAASEYRSGQITGIFYGRDDYTRAWLSIRADRIREGS